MMLLLSQQSSVQGDLAELTESFVAIGEKRALVG